MEEHQSLSHTVWDCKYHVVFIPRCRRKTLYLELRKHLGEVFHKLAAQKEAKIVEGHLMPDHVHMMISIPPKYAVSQVVDFIKGKSASTWRASTETGSATSWASTSGRAASSSTPWGGTRTQSALTSATTRRRIRDWTNSISGVNPATFRWLNTGAASATPSAASGGSNYKAPGFAGGYLRSRLPRASRSKPTPSARS